MINLDLSYIEKIIKNTPYSKLSEFAGVSPSAAKKWKSGEKDWRKSRFDSIANLVQHYEEEMKRDEFNEAVAKYDKHIEYSDAISEIFQNLADSLEIGDTQDFTLSGAQSNRNSVSFEFEVVSFDDDGLPEFEFDGIIKEH